MADVKHNWTKTDWSTALDAAITKGLTMMGTNMERSAALKAPVGQYPGTGRVGGRLKGSITYAVHGRAEDARSDAHNASLNTGNDKVSMPSAIHTLYVGTNVEYAPYVEYGWWVKGKTYGWFKPGRGYLRGAFDEQKPSFQKILNGEIHNAVLKYGK